MTAIATRRPRLILVPDDDVSEPARAVPDQTEEFSAQDVLDMLEVASRSWEPPSSIPPVGMDAEPAAHLQLGELAARRRGLQKYVLGSLALACAILVVASLKPANGAARTTTEFGALAREVTTPGSRPQPAQAPPQTEAVPPATTALAGLIRFTAPPGWAWLDGVQLTASSALTACGPHQVQIGGEEAHEVMVPCGGEVVVTR